MLIGLLELKQTVTHHAHLYLFTVFVVLTWALWAVKVVLSNRYRPWTAPYRTTTSVIIPVVDEPLELFRDVLSRIVGQGPDEVVVVINGKRNVALEGVCEEFGAAVEWVWTPVPGKRNAVRVGAERVGAEVVLLVDSDTIWTADTLAEIVKPFVDRSVGGVTTRQRILDPDALLFDPVGRLAREQPRAVLDAGAERARHRRLPARSHDRIPARRPGRLHARLHDQEVPRCVHGGLG